MYKMAQTGTGMGPGTAELRYTESPIAVQHTFPKLGKSTVHTRLSGQNRETSPTLQGCCSDEN